MKNAQVPRKGNNHVDDSKFTENLLLQACDEKDTSNQGVTFLPVVYVSTFNLVVNIIRPDPAIVWQV